MALQGRVGLVPNYAGNNSWLPFTRLRKHWTRVLLQLVVLLVGLYTALHMFLSAPDSFGSARKRQRGDIPAAVSCAPLSPGLQSGDQYRDQYSGMFDFSFQNGTLAARAYRTCKNRITAVLLLPVNAQSATPPSTCTYQGETALSIRFRTGLGEIHDGKVAPVSVECTFASHVQVSVNGSDVMEITGLGMDVSGMQRVPVVDYYGYVSRPFDWTVCTPTLHGSPRYPWIDQWLHYYTDELKVDHVFIYSALEGQTTQVLNDSGVTHGLERVSLVNVFSQLAFEPYYHGQTLAMHDCLILNRHLGTKWVMFQDFDEVLTIPNTFSTPLDYFLQSSHIGVTALTFGNWFFYANKCLPETSVQESERGWPWIARMVPYSSPFCGYLCADWQGRRKYVLQPDEHDALFVHNPLGGNVRHVNVNSAYVRHFQGATDYYGLPICKESVSSDTAMRSIQT